MNTVDKARMIALEADQLAENVERWFAKQTLKDEYSNTCVNIGDGGSWSAIMDDIVKIRRDLINLRDSLPKNAFGKLERDA